MSSLSLRHLTSASVEEILADYVRMSLEQYEYNLDGDFRSYNMTVPRQIALEAELRRRDGDQRRALLALFDHPNMQVRLNAARAARPVAPVEARRKIEEIAASGHYPQSADAGSSLSAMDRGIYKPD
ncbi:DUF2019 domain-containing protein [Aurantimonas sp. VKM B-3413]|uniref:DUF2019 domain-containing protein n=1 Tax=Aurantimonas sp. VKM B-3413 TaxID=2779401 RepID=UPI001E4E0863|nr:DUF2019 domain-containing protein [Aurantimonas sp. VKM B-3413]MCB8839326.1 DUF2019 domain-containing protein [Aurantimonas sp. VKM B-3413]